MTGNDEGVVVTGLVKRYGRTAVVDDVSFAVRPGAVTALLGPNGAGKTTTLKMILGLTRPTAGRVRIDGAAYREIPQVWRTVGSMLDTQRAHPQRTAYNHLRWLAAGNDIPVRRIGEVLAEVGLEEMGDRRVGAFSLGMSQRLSLAAALLGDPRILLLDEPTNGLDPAEIFWARELIRTRAEQGCAVLVSSHLLSEVARIADRVVVLGGGRLLADATVDEFLAHHCCDTLEDAFLAATAEHSRHREQGRVR